MFTPNSFIDGSAGNTPITAATLNNLETGLVAADITNPASAAAVALAGIAGARVPAAFYDDFTTIADGPLAGHTPIIGPAWRTTGAAPTTIASGSAVSTAIGYAYARLARMPDGASSDVAFIGTAFTMTMAFCLLDDATMLNNMVHFNFGPTGFTLSCRRDGEVPFPVLISAAWVTPVPQDGVTFARFSIGIRGSTATIIGPNSEIFSVTDPRIKALAGTTVFIEPLVASSSSSKVRTYTAFDRVPQSPQSGQAAISDITDFKGDQYGRTAGNRGTMAEVTEGAEPSSGMPSVTFGTLQINGSMTAAATIGATSILTNTVIPPGSAITIESGSAKETFTSGAFSTGSASPYTTPLTTALTINHPALSSITAIPTSQARALMYLNTANGYFYLPNNAVLVAPAGNLYLGSGLDTFISRDGNGPSVGLNTTLRGFMSSTAGRKSASAANQGAQAFDLTLGIPIWSDGTNWRNAAGTVV